MTRDEARSELIRIAADLVRMQAPLPANPEDHRQKTYSAGVVARAMEKHEDRLKDLAVRVRKAWGALK